MENTTATTTLVTDHEYVPGIASDKCQHADRVAGRILPVACLRGPEDHGHATPYYDHPDAPPWMRE